MINPIKIDDKLISSSLIRKEIENGQIENANKYLGEKFFIEGKVVKGKQTGRKLGFKTANIDYPKQIIEIPSGVYISEVKIKNKIYKALLNYGNNPTFNADKKTPEVHILNFEKDIYGEKIKIYPLKKIREEKKFKTSEELKEQIEKDMKEI